MSAQSEALEAKLPVISAIAKDDVKKPDMLVYILSGEHIESRASPRKFIILLTGRTVSSFLKKPDALART